MKLLTLNCHSLAEQNYKEKLEHFVTAIAQIKPDIIALQEVNQSISAPVAGKELREYYQPCDPSLLRNDNHVANIARMLREIGISYYWTWLPVKKGYDKYDEGLAIMTLFPILEKKIITISKKDDYNDWKTRKIIGVRTADRIDEWFFCVHYGWWNDADEPFKEQWQRTITELPKTKRIWLMGDFNSPADSEGYKLMEESGWTDCYKTAHEHDNGVTVARPIDGWENASDDMRLDQIWCNEKVAPHRSFVIFNGENHPIVSDHYGVLTEFL